MEAGGSPVDASEGTSLLGGFFTLASIVLLVKKSSL